MAHISYVRQAQLAHSTAMTTVVPADLELNNFAVFCGEPQQRVNLAAHAISRYAGRLGIVVINDNSDMVRHLAQLPGLLGNPELRVRSDRGQIYDPLYGMSADAIVNLLAPMDAFNPMSHSIGSLRVGILAYLEIMEYQFSQSAGPFGDYPYNLDLLVELTRMPYKELQDRVLQYMPAALSHSISDRLSAAEIQQGVFACVSNLISTMKEYLWQPRGFADHTGISIIDSVAKRQIISIRVPHAHAPLLNYIDAELQVLANRNIPFLLVNCSVDIDAHPAMQKWFLDAHVEKPYFTAIIADAISSITRDKDQRSKLFSQYQQIFVYQCAGAEQAEPFSVQFGQYYRKETERSFGHTREAFHIFRDHQNGTVQRYVAEPNIRVEDLTYRPDGILLCGSAYPLPILIDYFDTTGGIYNGTFLP